MRVSHEFRLVCLKFCEYCYLNLNSLNLVQKNWHSIGITQQLIRDHFGLAAHTQFSGAIAELSAILSEINTSASWRSAASRCPRLLTQQCKVAAFQSCERSSLVALKPTASKRSLRANWFLKGASLSVRSEIIYLLFTTIAMLGNGGSYLARVIRPRSRWKSFEIDWSLFRPMLIGECISAFFL